MYHLRAFSQEKMFYETKQRLSPPPVKDKYKGCRVFFFVTIISVYKRGKQK